MNQTGIKLNTVSE